MFIGEQNNNIMQLLLWIDMETKAMFYKVIWKKEMLKNELLPNDGVNLTLPKSLDEMDINYFIVESALGTTVTKNI